MIHLILLLVQMIFVQALLKSGQQIMMAGVMLLVIGSAIYYPISLEKQKAFTDIYGEINLCKNSNYLSKTCLSLPMYPHLEEEDVLRVCKVIKKII